MQTRPLALLALLLAMPAPGCIAIVAGAAIGAGAILYSENEARADFRQELDTVWQAAVAATGRAGFAVPEGIAPGATGGEIDAGEAHLVVERHAGDITRVRVRIGTFHTDEHRRIARLILEDIGDQLARER